MDHPDRDIRGNKNNTEKELREQTLKWLARLEEAAKDIRSTGKLDNKQYGSLVENMTAYIKDAHHFIEEKDYVRSFEAVVYAWGILETCQRVGIIKEQEKD